MATIVLCGDPNSEAAPDNAIFITADQDIVEQLKRHKPRSVATLWFADCGLSRLFSGETPHAALWDQFYRVLQDQGELLLTIPLDLSNVDINGSNFRVVLQHLNAKFIMYKHDKAGLHFHKIITLEPATMTSNDIHVAVRNKQRLEGPLGLTLMNKDKEICTIISKQKKILGKGVQGTVYHLPEWRSDVVIKAMKLEVQDRLEEKIGAKGERSTDDILEVLSSAVLNDLTTGQSRFGQSVHIPRFELFFSCQHEGDSYMYLVEELLDRDFKSWSTDKTLNPAPYAAFKCMLWQCLHTLIFLNRMGWSHGDASHRNFMVQKVGNPYYFRNVNIGGAKEWTYKLDGQTWKVKNLGWLAKICDFGFMQHFQDPRITWFENIWLESHRVPTSRVAPGADIGYLLLYIGFTTCSRNTGNRDLLHSMSVLYQDWFKLLGVKEPDHMKFFYRVLDEDPQVSYLILPSARLTKAYEDIDVSTLLNSAYFADVVSH
jgi:hypothetical protein